MSLDSLASQYGRLYLRLHRLLDKRMARSGASLARTKLLLCLKREGPMRATDIAELFSLAPRTVTESLDGMERDGLVVRTPDAHDRRVKRVSITEEGLHAIAETEPLRQKLIGQIFGTLSEAECEQLEGLFVKLAAQVDAAEAAE